MRIRVRMGQGHESRLVRPVLIPSQRRRPASPFGLRGKGSPSATAPPWRPRSAPSSSRSRRHRRPHRPRRGHHHRRRAARALIALLTSQLTCADPHVAGFCPLTLPSAPPTPRDRRRNQPTRRHQQHVVRSFVTDID